MLQYLYKNIPFPWKKKGRIYEPNMQGFSHASHPSICHLEKDDFLLAFNQRDSKQRSHIFLVKIRVSNGDIKFLEEPHLELKPGNYGYFDCDGVLGTCFITVDDCIYLGSRPSGFCFLRSSHSNCPSVQMFSYYSATRIP